MNKRRPRAGAFLCRFLWGQLVNRLGNGKFAAVPAEFYHSPEPFCPSHPFVQDARCSSRRGVLSPEYVSPIRGALCREGGNPSFVLVYRMLTNGSTIPS